MPLTTPSPAHGLLKVLQGISGFATGWTMVVGDMQDGPTDQRLVLRDLGGPPSEVRVAIDYPHVQVLVRGGAGATGYLDAFQKIIDVRNALVAIPSAAAYPELTSCIVLTQPIYLGLDDKNRPIHSMTLRLIVSFDTAGYRS